MDLSVEQIISKGNGSYWSTGLTDLSEPATISMVVPAGELAEGETYTVVREHYGVYSEMVAGYNKETETLEFESDGFSTFLVQFKQRNCFC